MNIQIRELEKGELEKMMEEHRRLNPDLPIRENTKAALERWVKHGIIPGDFLTAVIENDLMKAMGRADSYNRATIFQICSYLYNEAPATCYGSPEKVKAYASKFKIEAKEEK